MPSVFTLLHVTHVAHSPLASAPMAFLVRPQLLTRFVALVA